MNSSRNKILVIVVILSITASGLFYWSYTNYAEVRESLDRLAAPSSEVIALNAVFRNLVEAEVDFNSYIITDDEDFLYSYEAKMSKVDSVLLSLEETLASNPEQERSLDSLGSVIGRKEDYLQLFYELKKQQKRNVFSRKALNRVERQIGDSALVELELLEKTKTRADLDTVEQISTVEVPVKKKGILRKIFGKKETRLDTIKNLREQVEYITEVSVDTNVVSEYVVDSTLNAVKGILGEVLIEELTTQHRLREAELDLIAQDKQFFENIKTITAGIIEEEEDQNKAKKAAALTNISNLTERIYLIGGVGIIFSAIFLFLLFQDLTKAGEYRRRLEDQKSKAEKLAQEKENFLSKMSHEIRTPLHNIIGFSDLLAGSELNGEQTKYLSAIGQSNIYLKELIDNILENAKMNADKFELEKSEVYIPDLAEVIEQVFEYKFLDKEVEFIVAVDPALNDKVLIFDALKLKQVIVNLVGNALKFTDKGYVKLSFVFDEHNANGNFSVSVEDTGKGIAEEERKRVFEQFGQGASGRHLSLTGTGLGLYITAEIAKRFDGKLSLESDEGKGSVFTFCFRADTKPKKGHRQEVPAKPKPGASGKFGNLGLDVVGVEDDKWNARLLEASLSNHVGSLRLFQNAEDALNFLTATDHVDIILTDINLPGMGGREFLDRIRELKINVPVVAVSAHMTDGARQEILDAGFDGVCFKPFTKSEIFNAVKSFADHEKPEKGMTLDHFKLFVDTDEELAEIVTLFHDELINKVTELERALEPVDLPKIEDVCHRLKTAADQVGRTDQGEALAGIEVLAKLGKEERCLEECRRLLPGLKELIDSVEVG